MTPSQELRGDSTEFDRSGWKTLRCGGGIANSPLLEKLKQTLGSVKASTPAFLNELMMPNGAASVRKHQGKEQFGEFHDSVDQQCQKIVQMHRIQKFPSVLACQVSCVSFFRNLVEVAVFFFLLPWSRKIESEPWVKAYERHPLVQSASRVERTRILLVALYMDATLFAKRDSLCVFTAHLLPSGTRHLALAVRTSSMCDRGCGGWCTLFPLYRVVLWSLVSLASGKTPFRDTMGLHSSPATTNAKQ